MRSPKTKNNGSKSWLLALTLVFSLIGACVVQPARADTYYWNTSPTSGLQSGSGTWDTAIPSWSPTTAGGNPLLAWPAGNDADFYADGTSTVTVNGNQTVGNITFANSGYTLTGGTITMTGGTITANADATIAASISSTAEFTKLGAGTLFLTGNGTYNFSLDANVNLGTLDQSAGTATVSSPSSLYLGYSPADNGTYNLSGTGVLSAPNAYVGWEGTGTFTQTGGTNNVSASLFLGCSPLQAPTSTGGSYNLIAGLLSASTECLSYGFSTSPPTGIFTQSGGTNNVSANLYVGYSGSGTYKLSGPGVLSAPSEYVGFNGTGSFTQSAGSNTTNLALASSLGSSGTYTLDGGTLVLAGLTAGSGTAVFNFNGGVVQASGPFSTSVPMTLGTSGGGATFDTAGYSVTCTGALSGPGGLTKEGSGTLILTASNDYQGGTSVDDGLLVIDSSDAILSGSTLATGPDGAVVLGDPALPSHGNAVGGLSPSAPGAFSVANFRVSATPEPSTFALLLAASFGLAGVVLHRRRSAARR